MPALSQGHESTFYIGCLSILETHVTADNSINNNVVFIFVSELKIIHSNNSIRMPWTKEGKYFASLLIWRQNHSTLSQNH